MYTILELVTLGAQFLSKYHIANARRESEDLIGDVLSLSRTDIYMKYDYPVEDKELAGIRNHLRRRAKGEPLAYIQAKVSFYGCILHVSSEVLIPRQETEILVDKVACFLAQEDLQGKRLLDLCCGSGCIGLSLKKKFPQLQVLLSDISERALTIAKENAHANGVEVEFLQGDFLEPLKEKVDYVVCNPPYISQSEYETLDVEVKHFEPKQALVSGPTGLEFYVKLAEELPHRLQAAGQVWLESGFLQSESILDLFYSPLWVKKRVEKDLAGHNRFIFLEIE